MKSKIGLSSELTSLPAACAQVDYGCLGFWEEKWDKA